MIIDTPENVFGDVLEAFDRAHQGLAVGSHIGDVLEPLRALEIHFQEKGDPVQARYFREARSYLKSARSWTLYYSRPDLALEDVTRALEILTEHHQRFSTT